MKNHPIIEFLSIAILLFSSQAIANSPPDLILKNGHWFDGNGFKQRTVRVRNGVLDFKIKEPSNGKIIDISEKYVIPPFAEAHNHNLESSYQLDKRIANYLRDGVFYVKVQSSIKKRILPLMQNYNHPLGLDISLAHAPITGTDGHPVGVRKRYLERGHFRGLFNSLSELESHGYFFVDNKRRLREKWPRVVASKPDFIKVMLVYSEEYDKRKNDKAYFGKKGLNPALLPELVSLAHKNSLRVSVHVATPFDFRQALLSGADEITHLPGYSNGLRITEADAKLAAHKGVVVITTASLAAKRKSQADYPQLIDSITNNLRVLKEAGVTLAIGSDTYNDTSAGEVSFLRELGVFSNLELLKMWSENSAKTTFPDRKIGELRHGYEASFLVLNENPLRKPTNSGMISLRIKEGHILGTELWKKGQ